MTSHDPIHVCWTIDCEATQEAIDDTALGIRSLRGFCDLLLANGCAGTLFVVPGDARADPALLRDLAGAGLQVGLHFHPQEEGHQDYCGAYTADEQYAMYRRAREQFADAVSTKWRGESIGGLGQASCYSFQSNQEHDDPGGRGRRDDGR